VEDVLLLELGSSEVPVLAVFAAAPEVRDREQAPSLHPDQVADVEVRRDRDVEAAVAVEEDGRAAVLLPALPAGQEHRHLRAVLARVEDLAGFVGVGIETELGLAEDRARSRAEVVAVDRRRTAEALERVERLV